MLCEVEEHAHVAEKIQGSKSAKTLVRFSTPQHKQLYCFKIIAKSHHYLYLYYSQENYWQVLVCLGENFCLRFPLGEGSLCGIPWGGFRLLRDGFLKEVPGGRPRKKRAGDCGNALSFIFSWSKWWALMISYVKDEALKCILLNNVDWNHLVNIWIGANRESGKARGCSSPFFLGVHSLPD